MSRAVLRQLVLAFALLLIIGLTRRRSINKNKMIVQRPTSFKTVVDLIISQLEGGYFHPDMLTDGRLNISRPSILKAYQNSGETLYGIDRRNFKVKDIRLDKFWAEVDKQGLRKKIDWNKLPEQSIDKELRTYVYGFMQTNYQQLERRYLTSEARQVVNNYPPLFLQFVYASWNGPGFFQKYAKIINQNPNKNPSLLFDDIQAARMCGPDVIKQGAGKIDQIATYLLYA